MGQKWFLASIFPAFFNKLSQKNDCQQISNTQCCVCELQAAASYRGELKLLQNPGEDDKNNYIHAVATEKYWLPRPFLEKQ